MAIAKNQFNNILGGIFKAGNKIALLRTMPDPSTELGWSRVTGEGYQDYEIKEGDFSVRQGEVTSQKNMMFYLCDCDDPDGHGLAAGFAVFGNNELLYYGEFKQPMTIANNTVPVIKKYNAGSNEGVRVTMTSEDISVTAE